MHAGHSPLPLLLLLLGLGAGAAAQDPGGAEPLVRFETLTHDFGKIPDTGPVSHRFVFRNAAAHAVGIVAVETSCSCTSARADRDVYGPGDEGFIEAVFDPRHRQGREFNLVTLRLHDPAAPPVELRLHVETLARTWTEPATLWLGEIERSRFSSARRLTVLSRLPGFRVSGFRASDARFGVSRAAERTSERDGDTVREVHLDVVFGGSPAVGTCHGQILVETTDPDRRLVSVPVVAEVLGPLRIVPDRIWFRPEAGADAVETVTLASRSGTPFRILDTTIEPPPGFTVVLTADPAAGAPALVHRVRLCATPPGALPAGSDNVLPGLLRVRTDVGLQPEIFIALTGVAPVAGSFPSPRRH